MSFSHYFFVSLLVLFVSFNLHGQFATGFEDGFSTDWQGLTGDFEVNQINPHTGNYSIECNYDPGNGTVRVVTNSNEFGYGAYEAWFYVTGGISDAGIVWMFQSEANHYGVNLPPANTDNPAVKLYKKVNGTTTVLAEPLPPFGLNEWFKIGIHHCENIIRIFIDDELQFEVFDDQFSEPAKMGFRTYNGPVYCDDISYIPLKNDTIIETCGTESIEYGGMILEPGTVTSFDQSLIPNCPSSYSVTVQSIDEEFFSEYIATHCSTEGFEIPINGTIYNEQNPTGSETISLALCDSIVEIELTFVPGIGSQIIYNCDVDSGIYTLELSLSGGLPSLDGSNFSVAGSASVHLAPNESILLEFTENEPYELIITDLSSCETLVLADQPQACSKLAIDLLSQWVESTSKGNIINWITATEIDNKEFKIRTSENGQDFKELAIVEGAGNSSSQINYYFIDRNRYASSTVYYQISAVDFEEKESGYPILAVSYDKEISQPKLLSNPVKGDLIVELPINAPPIKSISIVNLAGQTICSDCSFSKTARLLVIDETTSAQKGQYLVILKFRAGESVSIPFHK